MTQKTATVVLVNNKDKEPEFLEAFKKVSRQNKVRFQNISAADCAYSYHRKNNQINIYCDGKKINITQSKWFVRRWGSHEENTALLSIILDALHVPFHDSKINSVHEIRTSKLSHAFQLAKNGVQSPSTWVVPITKYEVYKAQIIKSLKYPIVVKARGGSGARVWKCQTEIDLDSKINTLRKEGKDNLLLLQEFIENKGDIRVIVYKNKVIASILRTSNHGFLNYVSRGGSATFTTITRAEARTAINAAKTIGLDLAGVDLVREKQSSLIFEVNKAPDITSFHEAAEFNIAEKIANLFIADSK